MITKVAYSTCTLFSIMNYCTGRNKENENNDNKKKIFAYGEFQINII